MDNKSTLKLLKTAAAVSKALDFLCTFSTAVTAVAAIIAICSTAKKLSA